MTGEALGFADRENYLTLGCYESVAPAHAICALPEATAGEKGIGKAKGKGKGKAKGMEREGDRERRLRLTSIRID